MFIKTISRKEFKTLVNNYILNAIDCSGYTVLGTDTAGNLTDLSIICQTPKDQVNFVMDCFESEYLHHNNRNGNKVTLFAEWLSGLPSSINIDFENYRIIEIAKEWESIPTNATNHQEQRILDNWFNFIANKFFQLHKALNLPRKEVKPKKSLTELQTSLGQALLAQGMGNKFSQKIENRINRLKNQISEY